jgi:hypothetical protein
MRFKAKAGRDVAIYLHSIQKVTSGDTFAASSFDPWRAALENGTKVYA